MSSGFNTYDDLAQGGYYTGGVSKDALADLDTSGVSNSIPSTSVQHLVDSLRNINWSREYLWNAVLSGVPFPFDANGIGLPLVDVEDKLALGATYDFESSTFWLRVPQKRASFDLKLTLLDDEHGTLERFFEGWFNQIYGDEGVLPINLAVKRLSLNKLNSKREVILNREYLVFPTDTLMGDNRTESGPRRFGISLVVARYINPIVPGNPSTFTSKSTVLGTYLGSSN